MYMYKLINHMLYRMLKTTIWFFAAFILIETFLFYNAANTVRLSQYRFEQVLDRAGTGITFFLFFVLIIIIFAAVIIGLFNGSKSIYAVLKLPIKPSGLLVSCVVPCVVNMLILFCLQLLLIILFGLWLPSFFPEEILSNGYMDNYIFLALIRYRPVSVLFPISFLQIIRTLLLAVTPAIAGIYIILIVVSRRYEGAFGVLVCTVLSVLMIINGFTSLYTLIGGIILLIIVSLFMLVTSIKYIKRRAFI